MHKALGSQEEEEEDREGRQREHCYFKVRFLFVCGNHKKGPANVRQVPYH